ncbi:glycosyltransferase [Pedobacter sp. LMG 31464]|uniref:Glycosyltransferase n=1 Tax=Pedobacter planticolens TaxID=2679964 RepID=A0A923ITV9_9SPHI|nr:glycosyltransferase family 2 protein [Pedobacter planticolens]MBB2144103.1 glycosyltransferase [Pedobacter planticolens]
MKVGISVIICCYNSENRIEQTLAHLARQKLSSSLPAELILVNNNSTDKTVILAEKVWQTYHSPFHLLIVAEPTPGLSNARKKGIAMAKYDYLIFCDDDNWLNENYLETIRTYFDSNPDIAIVGGIGEPVFEKTKPWWFDQFDSGYAVGKQAEKDQYLNTVYGAGMGLRKSAVKNSKFISTPFLLKDREGKTLSSGGDSELCLRTRLLGYKVFYTEKLSFKHELTASRLTWEYLVRLHDGFAHAFVPLYIYESVLNEKKIGTFYWLKRSFFYYGRVLKYAIFYLPKIINGTEGKIEIIHLRNWFIIANSFLKYNFQIRKIYKRLMVIKLANYKNLSSQL